MYKRRGNPDHASKNTHTGSSSNPTSKKIQFVLDISGSMYRYVWCIGVCVMLIRLIIFRSGDARFYCLSISTPNILTPSQTHYRFNGQDRRLERMLEATLLVMESMPSDPSSPLQYSLSGHSGDSYDISLVPFDGAKPADEAEKNTVFLKKWLHTRNTV